MVGKWTWICVEPWWRCEEQRSMSILATCCDVLIFDSLQGEIAAIVKDSGLIDTECM